MTREDDDFYSWGGLLVVLLGFMTFQYFGLLLQYSFDLLAGLEALVLFLVGVELILVELGEGEKVGGEGLGEGDVLRLVLMGGEM